MFHLEIYDYDTKELIDVSPELTLQEALECIQHAQTGEEQYYDYERKTMMNQKYVSHNKFIKRVGDRRIKGYQVFLQAKPVKTLRK
ncbi:hypothetical protein F9802_02110 [Bacillus aerolatus]|uniref:Uncharacterized protein n=1 Tax=Bacillus aerolatus TaxID=2653354 RepID=A0A6I1FJW7_9BACI|nr:hypothetical protein [Bacillus aerolatus]KAB7708955.1 hypothetical protein F9802_02110 [Bacillus aerolatus]